MNLQIRRPRVDELPLLQNMHSELNGGFPFPNLQFASSMYVVEYSGNIVGFGVLLPIFESIVVLDQKQKKEIRLEALNLLVNKAEYELSSQGILEFHAFVQNKGFFNLLKKRFGFKTTKGTALVKVING